MIWILMFSLYLISELLAADGLMVTFSLLFLHCMFSLTVTISISQLFREYNLAIFGFGIILLLCCMFILQWAWRLLYIVFFLPISACMYTCISFYGTIKQCYCLKKNISVNNKKKEHWNKYYQRRVLLKRNMSLKIVSSISCYLQPAFYKCRGSMFFFN